MAIPCKDGVGVSNTESLNRRLPNEELLKRPSVADAISCELHLDFINFAIQSLEIASTHTDTTSSVLSLNTATSITSNVLF